PPGAGAGRGVPADPGPPAAPRRAGRRPRGAARAVPGRPAPASRGARLPGRRGAAPRDPPALLLRLRGGSDRAEVRPAGAGAGPRPTVVRPPAPAGERPPPTRGHGGPLHRGDALRAAGGALAPRRLVLRRPDGLRHGRAAPPRGADGRPPRPLR